MSERASVNCAACGAPIAAGTANCRCCAASTWRCAPARSSRWWRRRAPANRRCCIWPACWRSRMAARCWSAGAMPARFGDAERTAIRRDAIGFVYQFHHLLGEFSALENVVLPQMIAGRPRAAAESGRGRCWTALGLARAARASAGQAVGRRAAARGDRARAGERAARAAGRRADRQPRCRHRGRRVRGVAARGAPPGRGRADRHAQPGTGGAHGSHGDAAWREGGGVRVRAYT